jgi:hypothetical protein
MPFTFSHPLAVVPVRRFCPDRLNFAALAAGSMSPDFGYYVRQFPIAAFAHTIPGTFAICLPTALMALGVFYLVRRPLCFVLPQPHRAALMPRALRRPAFSFPAFLIAVFSVLLGAWTHTIWDSFTHDGGWAVERFAGLRSPLIYIDSATLPVSYCLQQASTFGGGALLAIIYFRWLRRHPNDGASEPDRLSDRARYVVLGVLATIAVAFAVPLALRTGSLFEGYLAFRVFVFRTSVYSIATFIPLVILSSVALYVVYRRKD